MIRLGLWQNIPTEFTSKDAVGCLEDCHFNLCQEILIKKHHMKCYKNVNYLHENRTDPHEPQPTLEPSESITLGRDAKLQLRF